MSRQETFDEVCAFLIRQGMQATDGSECMYRATLDDGRVIKCAAGCLIPDDRYGKWMEGHTVACANGAVLDAGQKLHDLMVELGHDPMLVARMQSAHDAANHVKFVESFIQSAANVAMDFGLSTSVLYTQPGE